MCGMGCLLRGIIFNFYRTILEALLKGRFFYFSPTFNDL